MKNLKLLQRINYLSNFKKSYFTDKKLPGDEINTQTKVDDFFGFMEENMNKYSNKENSEIPNLNNSLINDESKLIEIMKCPMTDSDLEISPEGLKVSHIIYPKRNGIYILKEDEAIFKFD